MTLYYDAVSNDAPARPGCPVCAGTNKQCQMNCSFMSGDPRTRADVLSVCEDCGQGCISCARAAGAEAHATMARNAARYCHVRDNIRDLHSAVFSGATPLMYKGKRLPLPTEIDAVIDASIARNKPGSKP